MTTQPDIRAILQVIGPAADVLGDPGHHAQVLRQMMGGKRVKGSDAQTVTLALVNAIHDMQWMARRYADGRMTYAPGMVNDATRVLLALGVPLQPDPVSGSVWAMDGMDGLPAYAPLPQPAQPEAEAGA